jgi:hypothetical protein
MLITRYAKIVMVACLAIFCLIVVFTNLTDYSTNFLFVKHVLSMDTTFPGNALMYRSITSPAMERGLCAQYRRGGHRIPFLAGAIRLLEGAERLRRRVQRRQGAYGRRCARGLHSVVLRLHGDRRGVVRHLAVDDLERQADLREPAGRRSAPVGKTCRCQMGAGEKTSACPPAYRPGAPPHRHG